MHCIFEWSLPVDPRLAPHFIPTQLCVFVKAALSPIRATYMFWRVRSSSASWIFRGHTPKKKKLIFFSQELAPNNLSARDVASCPPPIATPTSPFHSHLPFPHRFWSCMVCAFCPDYHESLCAAAPLCLVNMISVYSPTTQDNILRVSTVSRVDWKCETSDPENTIWSKEVSEERICTVCWVMSR